MGWPVCMVARSSTCGRPAVTPLLWAQVKPEARTYYELSAATLKFVFPRPGFLEGIKGRSQAITKMTNVRVATLFAPAHHSFFFNSWRLHPDAGGEWFAYRCWRSDACTKGAKWCALGKYRS